MENTYPVLTRPVPYRQTEVTIGLAALLVDRADAAIFEATRAMALALELYRQKHPGGAT